MRTTRRRALVVGLLLALPALAACDSAPPASGPSEPGGAATAAPAGSVHAPPAVSGAGGLQALVVASQLVVGVHRFPIGILDHNAPVNDASVHVQALLATTGGAELRGQSDAPFRGQGLQGRGLYVAQLPLDVAGQWLAVITAQRPGAAPARFNVPFRVAASSAVPAVGQRAPRSHNPTLRDVPDVGAIDSGSPPDDMHDVSIADAMAARRPALVVFATPAFCVSQACGPQVEAVRILEPAYRDRLAFIHVEVYQDFRPDPAKMRLSRTMLEWHLQTEPWVFLLDGDGIVRAEFEGSAATDELRQALDQLLA